MSSECLVLTPRDGFFVKDARGWYTSETRRVKSLDWPPTATVLGALRGAYGRRREASKGRPMTSPEWLSETKALALGRTLCLRRVPGEAWDSGHRMWPVPADAVYLPRKDAASAVVRLEPRQPEAPTLGLTDDPAREALWRPVPESEAKPEPAPRWWTEAEFVAWLCGRNVAAPDVSKRRRVAPVRRMDVHLRIHRETRTSEEGGLFSVELSEPYDLDRNEWAVGCEVTLPDGAATLAGELVTLGGRGGLTFAARLDESVFAAPDELLAAFDAGSRGLRLVVVTPALLEEGGWLPDGFTAENGEYRGRLEGVEGELVLRAAFVPRPYHLAGWDMANHRAKNTDRFAPPGAVYFLERADGGVFGRAEAEALWLAAVGGRTEEGFGRVAPGVWQPKDNG